MSAYYNENQLNVHYTSEFYTQSDADIILKELADLPFNPITLNIGGKKFTPRRKVLAFGDAGLSYSFSGTSVPALPWSPLMQKLKADVEKTLGVEFNYVLLNLYPDGNSKIGHHKDNEDSLDSTMPVCVLSFGAPRTIEFKRPQCDTTLIELQHGSLYVMYPPTNNLFTHGISAEPVIQEPRISLTFRKITPSKGLQKRKVQENHQSSAKKPKIDDCFFIPSGDWFEDLFKEKNSLLTWWNLEGGVFVLVYCDTNGLRVHIRICKYKNEYDWYPSKRGVIMHLATWNDLCTKLKTFNLQHSNTSFIANNQLAVFRHDEDYCVFQQIFKSEDVYTLKLTSIKLAEDQLDKLKDNAPNITENLVKVMFTVYLPQLILTNTVPCEQNIHVDDTIAKEQIFKLCLQEIRIIVNQQFFCEGCEFNSARQDKHSCLMLTDADKFNLTGNHLYLLLNVRSIAKTLRERYCTCHYTSDFFEKLSVDDYISFFKNEFNPQ